MYSAGISYLIELFDCPPDILDDDVLIGSRIGDAVGHANATLLHQVSRRFEPQGVTAFALLAESHISIHTWPELGYAAIDIFTCGERAVPEQACRYLVSALEAGRHSVRQVERGVGLDENTSKPQLEPSGIVASPVSA
ncbi:MAG: adenosylmethionine decarboxylase [Gemmatimonadota bacterium]|nr:MAG: adenosylmethionine decarboxylase [Gemmatimonadota bacterium]